jgi:hypothetical protein
MACANAADPSGPSRSINLVLHCPGVGHFATTTMTQAASGAAIVHVSMVALTAAMEQWVNVSCPEQI